MILAASSVGEIAHSISARGAKGRVRRVFRSSAYIESRGGLMLLLQGALRSPMTINLVDGDGLMETLAVGQAFELGPTELRISDTRVRLGQALIFRSGLLGAHRNRPISEAEIVKAANALKLLYSASETSLGLATSRDFEVFADSVLRPLAAGRLAQVYRLPNYLGLLGRGAGFTPAGDDLVAGFSAAFNYYARGEGEAVVVLPLAELKRRTVAESAALVAYAQRGYVDEGMQKLILAGFGDEPLQFRTLVSDLASRGHTSGLDMSLGVLVLLACVSDLAKHGRALESSLEVLID